MESPRLKFICIKGRVCFIFASLSQLFYIYLYSTYYNNMATASASYPTSLTAVLALNVTNTVLSAAAAGGSIFMSYRLRKQYQMASILASLCSVAMLIFHAFAFARWMGNGGYAMVAKMLLLQCIFPPLLWCLLSYIIRIMALPRLRFQAPSDEMAQSRSILRLTYFITTVLVIASLILAILWGVSDSPNFNPTITAFYCVSVIGPLYHMNAFFYSLYKIKYYRDIRPFLSPLSVVLVLLCLGTLGAFAAVLVELTARSRDDVVYLMYTVMVRTAGLVALIMITFLFPTVWIRRIREHEIKNELMQDDGGDDAQPSWSPNSPYDTNQRDYITIDNQQQQQRPFARAQH
ncbi:hypothetical protein BDB00DRAFT_311476 [Zychaea mexicana]|uniref:uncharacterized protein n=1 Tax=Zychaea mexicana TaxID=64656 RepID=UPI0022FDF7E1|nr:uncharacterized protein BDB00DRAFT_311476 [Zychaea mexicana]KAI9494333.1 hypothetical protein BDB00DRAFT_311476 [Zychaea mexicana]